MSKFNENARKTITTNPPGILKNTEFKNEEDKGVSAPAEENAQQVESRSFSVQGTSRDNLAGNLVFDTMHDFIPMEKPEDLKPEKQNEPELRTLAKTSGVVIRRPLELRFERRSSARGVGPAAGTTGSSPSNYYKSLWKSAIQKPPPSRPRLFSGPRGIRTGEVSSTESDPSGTASRLPSQPLQIGSVTPRAAPIADTESAESSSDGSPPVVLKKSIVPAAVPTSKSPKPTSKSKSVSFLLESDKIPERKVTFTTPVDTSKYVIENKPVSQKSLHKESNVVREKSVLAIQNSFHQKPGASSKETSKPFPGKDNFAKQSAEQILETKIQKSSPVTQERVSRKTTSGSETKKKSRPMTGTEFFVRKPTYQHVSQKTTSGSETKKPSKSFPEKDNFATNKSTKQILETKIQKSSLVTQERVSRKTISGSETKKNSRPITGTEFFVRKSIVKKTETKSRKFLPPTHGSLRNKYASNKNTKPIYTGTSEPMQDTGEKPRLQKPKTLRSRSKAAQCVEPRQRFLYAKRRLRETYRVTGTRFTPYEMFPKVVSPPTSPPPSPWYGQSEGTFISECEMTDHILRNALAVVRNPAKIPVPRYAENVYGRTKNFRTSGLARFYVFKPDYGQIPEYIYEKRHCRMEFGFKDGDFDTEGYFDLEDNNDNSNQNQYNDLSLDNEFCQNYYSLHRYNLASGRMDQDPVSWVNFLTHQDPPTRQPPRNASYHCRRPGADNFECRECEDLREDLLEESDWYDPETDPRQSSRIIELESGESEEEYIEELDEDNTEY